MTRKEVNSSRVPVYRDAGFELYDANTTKNAFKNESEHSREPDKYIYSRYRNPTVVSAEEKIMKLEGCEWALLTQSGMSAIDTALSIFQNGKDTKPWLFFTEIYGGTISFIESVLRTRRGVDIHYFMPETGTYDLGEFEKTLSGLKPEFIYIESISNPMLIVADVTEIIRIAKKYGTKIIIDNTFATPWLFKPLENGADIIIHSATKYFSGHGNLTAGVICGNNKKIMQSAIEYRKLVGHMLSPDDAYRLQTQVQSFELRFARQCENAFKLAEYLNEIPLIKKVWFPGLKNHTSHNIAKKLFAGKGFGAMITFDFDGKDDTEKRARRDKFIRMVSEKIKLIPSLGDPDTILMPVEAVWGSKYPEPGMIRLSVGFEDYSELETTVKKALEAI
ncbi:MAG TPA: PLP-dependent aspartate aminotransferase family protein [Bacteroidales bacterium]|nr:PLP-dependent aspartate aminotransferase family protein [Bacteroidales bacterium]